MRIRIISQPPVLVTVDDGIFTVTECQKTENKLGRFTVGAVSEDLRHFPDVSSAHDLSDGFSSQTALKRAWAEGFKVIDSGEIGKSIVGKMLAEGKAEEIEENQV